MGCYNKRKCIAVLIGLLVFSLFSVEFYFYKINLTLADKLTTLFSAICSGAFVGGISWWQLRINLLKRMTVHMEEHIGSIGHVFNKANRYKIYKDIPMPEFYRKSKVLAYDFHGLKYNAAEAERYARAVLCFIFISKHHFDWGKIRHKPMLIECKKHKDEIKLFSYLMDKLYEEQYGGY